MISLIEERGFRCMKMVLAFQAEKIMLEIAKTVLDHNLVMAPWSVITRNYAYQFVFIFSNEKDFAKFLLLISPIMNDWDFEYT